MKYPSLNKAVLFIQDDNCCDEMVLSHANKLKAEFPKAEEFLATLTDEELYTFATGDHDEMKEMESRSPNAKIASEILNLVFNEGYKDE